MKKENNLYKAERVIKGILDIPIVACWIAIPTIALTGLYLNYGLFWTAIIILAGLGIVFTTMKVISFCFEVMNGRNRQ